MANKKFPTDTPKKVSLHNNDGILISDSESVTNPHEASYITGSDLMITISTELNLNAKADITYVDGINTQLTTDIVTLSGGIDNNTTDVISLSGVIDGNSTDVVTLSGDLINNYTEHLALSAAISGASGGLSAVVDDTTPQLGGALDGQGNIISDVELQSYSESIVTVASSGGILTLDYSQGNIFKTVLIEDVTSIVITNPPLTNKSSNVSLMITQDPVTPRTVAWGAIKWNDATTPVMTATIDAIDLYTMLSFDNGLVWFGFVAGQNMG